MEKSKIVKDAFDNIPKESVERVGNLIDIIESQQKEIDEIKEENTTLKKQVEELKECLNRHHESRNYYHDKLVLRYGETLSDRTFTLLNR